MNVDRLLFIDYWLLTVNCWLSKSIRFQELLSISMLIEIQRIGILLNWNIEIKEIGWLWIEVLSSIFVELIYLSDDHFEQNEDLLDMVTNGL